SCSTPRNSCARTSDGRTPRGNRPPDSRKRPWTRWRHRSTHGRDGGQPRPPVRKVTMMSEPKSEPDAASVAARGIVSARSLAAARESAELEAFIDAAGTFEADAPDVADFTFGNPHEMPLQGLVDALVSSAVPRSADWFAYKGSEQEPTALIAESLSRELGVPLAPEDVALTAGAFGAIGLAFHMLTDPGDEVVIPVPGWFLYAPMLRLAGVVPVEAALDPDTWDVDLEAIDAAITERTRIVVVNSPHNPTGRVYGPETWTAL